MHIHLSIHSFILMIDGYHITAQLFKMTQGETKNLLCHVGSQPFTRPRFEKKISLAPFSNKAYQKKLSSKSLMPTHADYKRLMEVAVLYAQATLEPKDVIIHEQETGRVMVCFSQPIVLGLRSLVMVYGSMRTL